MNGSLVCSVLLFLCRFLPSRCCFISRRMRFADYHYSHAFSLHSFFLSVYLLLFALSCLLLHLFPTLCHCQLSSLSFVILSTVDCCLVLSWSSLDCTVSLLRRRPGLARLFVCATLTFSVFNLIHCRVVALLLCLILCTVCCRIDLLRFV